MGLGDSERGFRFPAPPSRRIGADASALLIRIDNPPGALGVVAATAAAAEQSARAKHGAIWKARSPNPLSLEAFTVLQTNRNHLCSPHGTDADALSMVPLRQRDGRCFGVLVSLRPAVPDELLRAMAVTAGPLLERPSR